ncbi:NmrA family NAD(P)-binding protein [Streptomyces sp. NPDC050560]|uniref:NmrA family NAD(P)-binding protein n=1 Tax=Streptomyces sp. NPDC050560 TaxID=3365630 RepID=UPI0037981207
MTAPPPPSASTGAAPVVVTGATGRQGGATARRLLAAGRPVRALVRDPAAPAAAALARAGAALVRADFDDPASLPPALAGARGLFIVPPAAFGPGGTELDVARGRALADAAAGAGVDHVVFTGVASVPGGAPGWDGKYLVEGVLRARLPRVTVLRPARFMSNYLGTLAHGIEGIHDGVHRHLFPPDEPVQIIAVEDIAEFAALAFDDPERFGGRTLELAGDAPTPLAAAAAISEAVGSEVRYEQLTAEQAAALGPEVAGARERWLGGAHWHADIEALRVIHPGLRTLGTWLAETGAAALRAQLRADGTRAHAQD